MIDPHLMKVRASIHARVKASGGVGLAAGCVRGNGQSVEGRAN